MNIQTFRFLKTARFPSEINDFFENNYETYNSATPKDRDDIKRQGNASFLLVDLYVTAKENMENLSACFISNTR